MPVIALIFATLLIDPPGQQTDVPAEVAPAAPAARVAGPAIDVDRPEYIYVRRKAGFRAHLKTRAHFAAEMIESMDAL